MWLHTATVQGKGTFPFDMLRYDSCFPTTQEGVSRLLGYDSREITVSKYTARKNDVVWTSDRWASFGWFLTEQGAHNV